jgi:hypothetical protein
MPSDAKILYNATRHAHLWAKCDLAPPGTLSQTESLDQVLPPRSSSLLPPQVGEMLLSLVHQQPQVPLVDLVLPSSRLAEPVSGPARSFFSVTGPG